MVANWLYGVASQTARKAKAMRAKKRTHEKQMIQMPESVVEEKDCGKDLHHQLHQALAGLPAKFRVSIILCYLEGKTRSEAARQLGVPEGTLAAWVARGRAMLAKRLARNGLVLSSGALATALMHNTASASVPVSLASSTLQAASLLKNLRSASATRSTFPKKHCGRTVHRASGQLFLLRFTSFQQSKKRGTSCRTRSAQFSAKRNRKNALSFAASSLLRHPPALLSLGNVVEQSTMQLSPFY